MRIVETWIDKAAQARHDGKGRDMVTFGTVLEGLDMAGVKRLGGTRRDVQRTDGARQRRQDTARCGGVGQRTATYGTESLVEKENG